MKYFLQKLLKRKKLLVIFTLLIIGIGWFIKYKNSSKAKVESTRIERGEVREELVLSGEIKASEHASLNFLASGELNYIAVKEGQKVKKGEVLAKLDSTNAYQTFLQAEADWRRYETSLEKTYDDIQGHTKDESFAQRETRTIAETSKDKAYRSYVIAQKNLSNTILRSPFDGVVSSITHPYTGVNTSLTESQIEIVNPATIYFEVNADQSEVLNLFIDQTVILDLDSFSGETLDGKVSYVGYTPKSAEVGTVYKVVVAINSIVEDKVKIGMSGDAHFALSRKEGVLYLPPNFVKSDTGGKYVNLNKANNKKYIEVGIEGEDRVEVMGDIKEGDIVFD